MCAVLCLCVSSWLCMQTCICVFFVCVRMCVSIQGSAKYTALFLRAKVCSVKNCFIRNYCKVSFGFQCLTNLGFRRESFVPFNRHYVLLLYNATHIFPVDCKQHDFKMSLLKAFYDKCSHANAEYLSTIWLSCFP